MPRSAEKIFPAPSGTSLPRRPFPPPASGRRTGRLCREALPAVCTGAAPQHSRTSAALTPVPSRPAKGGKKPLPACEPVLQSPALHTENRHDSSLHSAGERLKPAAYPSSVHTAKGCKKASRISAPPALCCGENFRTVFPQGDMPHAGAGRRAPMPTCGQASHRQAGGKTRHGLERGHGILPVPSPLSGPFRRRCPEL